MAVDESKRTLLSYWWVLPVAGTVGAFGYMANYARRVTLDKHAPGPPNFRPGPRQAVAKLTELKGPYSFREFQYQKTPCLVMELPAPTPTSVTAAGRHFAAYSRLCTHLGCAVNPVEDTELLALSYNYRAEHPMLGCPCHFSVFDPQQQGQSVFGKALRPLARVQLEAAGGVLYARGLKPDPRLAQET